MLGFLRSGVQVARTRGPTGPLMTRLATAAQQRPVRSAATAAEVCRALLVRDVTPAWTTSGQERPHRGCRSRIRRSGRQLTEPLLGRRLAEYGFRTPLLLLRGLLHRTASVGWAGSMSRLRSYRAVDLGKVRRELTGGQTVGME